MPHFSGFLGNEWAESSKAGRHPSEDLAAGELDGLMKTIHLIPLDHFAAFSPSHLWKGQGLRVQILPVFLLDVSVFGVSSLSLPQGPVSSV